jgi:transglutaminase-like putative cysteine protease
MTTRPLEPKQWFSNDLEEHMAILQRQVDRSIRDGETRQLAVKIVSGSFDYAKDPRTNERTPVVTAFGHKFRAPDSGVGIAAKDEKGELTAIWDFVVLNSRYVYDPPHIDTFATVEKTLDAGGGDCFPEGTLVLRGDGQLVPIEQIEMGDRVHDGQRFVEVLKTWERGPKTIHRITMNNQTVLRLSDRHKVLVVPRIDRKTGRRRLVGTTNYGPGLYAEAQAVRVQNLKVGMDLLQPREFGGGNVELDVDDAFLVAMYLAEGYTSKVKGRVGLSGVAGRKGARERAEEILTRRGVHFDSREREIRFAKSKIPIYNELELGRIAIEKHLPHLDWGPQTVRELVAVLDQTDGGRCSNGKNITYSTISYTLALQYRVLQRMLGRSTSLVGLADHGGAGHNPIYRVTARMDDGVRPWAKIRAIEIEDTPVSSYDIMTTSGRVYLPESDVVVNQCDDQTILLAALLKSIGFFVKGRVISTRDNPDEWVHVYAVVGMPKDNPKKWVPLDPTFSGATPGWQYPGIAKYVDYDL